MWSFKYLLLDKLRNINRKYNKVLISNYEDNLSYISMVINSYLSGNHYQ